MNPLDIIEKYYVSDPEAKTILIQHSQSVTAKAIEIAKMHPEMHLDFEFIEQAAMLHDIGVFLCHAPEIGCYGNFPYISHGYLGADLIRKEGFERHALVCERHTGTGISLAMIEQQNLPLPQRDMRPQTLDEQLICFADKFYSKTHLNREKSVDKIKKSLAKYGNDSVLCFDNWCKLFLG